ncbi:hypothetical protein [Streptacidiphilus pinicola]|nr:hypothetical protein [Streptacidiphilus pinicola]
MLWSWAASHHKTLGYLLGRTWDTVWYVGIIQHGYDSGTPLFSNMAFFPLFPYAARGLTLVSPLSAPDAAIAVAWIAGAVAAWGLYAVGNLLHDRRTGIVLAMLWGALPHAVTESMGYSEGLFTALAAWTLYYVLTERWLAAGTLCLLAGLTRPTAVALIPAVCLAALIALVRRRAGLRAAAAIVLAPLGWLGYLAFVAHRTHHLDGWFRIQKLGWGSGFDGGVYTLREGRTVLGREMPLDLYLVTLVLAVAVLLFVLSVLDRQPWPLLVYSGLLLAVTLGGSGYYNAKARFLVVAFPLLLKPAVALAHARRGTVVSVLVFLTLVSAYCGGYLLLVWNHSP